MGAILKWQIANIQERLRSLICNSVKLHMGNDEVDYRCIESGVSGMDVPGAWNGCAVRSAAAFKAPALRYCLPGWIGR